MLFCSIEFIFLFLPVFLLIYYGLPRKYSNIVLFAGSLFFYWYGERKYFILILVSLAIHYALTRFSYGRSVRVRRACLALMLLYGFGTLFLFKEKISEEKKKNSIDRKRVNMRRAVKNALKNKKSALLF